LDFTIGKGGEGGALKKSGYGFKWKQGGDAGRNLAGKGNRGFCVLKRAENNRCLKKTGRKEKLAGLGNWAPGCGEGKRDKGGRNYRFDAVLGRAQKNAMGSAGKEP